MTDNAKLDIKLEMEHADLRNKDFYSQLSPDLQKSFSPLVAMRWMSGISDSSKYRDSTLLTINEVLNVNFWALKDHPELHWKLMATCGSGVKLYHNWIPMPKRKKVSKMHEFLLEWYPSANDQELDIILNKMTRETFEDFVKSTGCADDYLKETMANYDQHYGIKKTSKSSKSKK